MSMAVGYCLDTSGENRWTRARFANVIKQSE